MTLCTFPFKYAANGVTVVLKSGYAAGTTGKVQGDNSGKIYTAVNESQLRAMDVDTDDFTSVCTTLVTDMSDLFSYTISFNQPLDNWDVSNVTNMFLMFDNASSFNQPLNSWDVSNVSNMRNMFSNLLSFNQPLNNWDVSNVSMVNMQFMFDNAEVFNQDLSGWCVTNIGSEPFSFDTGADAWVLANSRPIWGTCP